MGLRRNLALAVTMVLLIAMILSGCQPKGQNGSGDNGAGADEVIVATVDGVAITKTAYDNNFALMENAYNDMFGENIWTQEIGGRPVKEIVQEELLENMIREKLILKYVEESGYEVSEQDVQEAYDNFKEVLNTDEETKAFYDEMDFDEAFIKKQITSQFIAEEFNAMIRSEVEADTQTLEGLYETETVLVSASHILVNDDATLEIIEQKIEAGEDFAELATEYSEDPGSASNGGSLGYFSRGKMVPEFEAVAFSLEVGEVSEPVQSQFGFHIIKVDDVQTIKDLEETGASEEEIEVYKQSIVDSLAQDAYAEKVSSLLNSAEVERFLDKIKE
jgi:foldase protein PrsA